MYDVTYFSNSVMLKYIFNVTMKRLEIIFQKGPFFYDSILIILKKPSGIGFAHIQLYKLM